MSVSPFVKLLVGALVVGAGCSDSASGDAGLRGDVVIVPQNPVDASADAARGGDAMVPPGFFPAPAPAFSTAASDPLSVQVSVSGEALAERGYDYTATPAEGQPVFVDGWELRFDRYLVVLDRVRLNRASPDPTMRGAVGGLVAQQDGPWIVDVHKRGALTGAGGPPETAVPLLVFRAPSAGGAFDPTARYAFSYDTAPAVAAMRNVNLTADEAGDVAQMIAHRWTTLFAGTATYRGRAPSASVDPSFVGYPTAVRFAFGFGAPASYLNCHNPDLGDADTAATRGVQPSATGHVRAQITMHTDHFFWDETDAEGTPLRFDAIAARAQGFGGDAAALDVTLAELAGAMPASLTDALGRPVLDRASQTMGVMDNAPPPAYAAHGAGGTVRTLRDFAVYNARGQGHLNSDGLCFVQPAGPVAY